MIIPSQIELPNFRNRHRYDLVRGPERLDSGLAVHKLKELAVIFPAGKQLFLPRPDLGRAGNTYIFRRRVPPPPLIKITGASVCGAGGGRPGLVAY